MPAWRPRWCCMEKAPHACMASPVVQRRVTGVLVVQLDQASTQFGNAKYYSNICKTIAAGFFMQASHLQPTGHYLTVKDNQVVYVHPSCGLERKPEWYDAAL